MKDFVKVMLENWNEANHDIFFPESGEADNPPMKVAEMLFNLMTEAEFLTAREMFSDNPPAQWSLDEMECCFAPDRIMARLDAST